MKKTPSQSAASLLSWPSQRAAQTGLIATAAAGLLLSACTPPMPPPPPPGRGRNLDVPPRYGVPEQQTRYFDGANMDPGAVQPPNPDAPLTSPDSIGPPPPSSGATPPVTVTPPGPTPPNSSTSPVAPPSSTPPPAPAPAADIPFATRIPGKPGFVKSPFDPSGQAIDVRDFQSGQKAKCPYTGKVFRVP